MRKRKKTPNLITNFEKDEPTKEEQVKALSELLSIMLEGYQDMVDRNDDFLTEEEKKQIEYVCLYCPI